MLWMQEHALRRHRFGGWVRALPPLTELQVRLTLPMPQPVMFEGERLPASYANFLIANKQVLVPVFNDVHDRVALNILAECFPDREIQPIYCGDFIWGLGTIHCMSQQVPLPPP